MFEIQSFLNEVSNKEKSEKESLLFLSHLLCKTYGWDYYTLIKQPIPFILSLMGGLQKEVEIQKKELDKTKKKH